MLVTAGAMLGIFAVVNSESHGILAASTDGESIAAIVLLTGFFALESRPASPIDPDDRRCGRSRARGPVPRAVPHLWAVPRRASLVLSFWPSVW